MREAIALGALLLAGAGDEEAARDEARREAESLLRTALGLTRAQLYARLTDEVPPAARERYRALLARRQAHEPISYLRGYKEFYGLEFRTDARALIPRPETELLVELALAATRARRRDAAIADAAIADVTIADVGTGCGCIAVALAAHLSRACVYATDVSPAALALARENAAAHALAGRIAFLEGDLLAPVPVPLDLIAANLPYVTATELAELPPGIAAYEPRAALDGGPDGLDLIRRLLAMAPAHLRPGGVVLLEIGWRQGEAAVALARACFPVGRVTLHQDYGGRDRVVVIET
ncbi:MAG: peptide chain release factor N(5)-glutamine methyltransferase [Chloroflexi bacterium]|nr:peptide chain release factor N(5)-glutamine methyltransferase [Chloroflexota bacterium]MBU1747333.1 peptide chain release factor N(5)-glutamine methyltransferase [Chloroflexota bacterium]MBU1878692.1 peptide chain release factor N(5)-glutamine methyltransferase [Chloroflexota bacterium]